MTCKICNSPLRERLENFWHDKNPNSSELITWCSDRGLIISKAEINHHKNHIVHIDKQETIPVEILDMVDFAKYCESLGLSPEDFRDLDKNFDKVIYGAQKAMTILFFKNTGLCNKKLDLALMDETTYPTEDIRGLRLIYDLFSSVTGLQTRGSCLFFRLSTLVRYL